MTRRFMLGLVCVAVGCHKAEDSTVAYACDLDRATIASWLTTVELGTRPQAGEPANRWGDELSSFRVVLEEPSFVSWCSTRSPETDSACWTAAGDSRPECKAARQELMELSVTGPACELDIKGLYCMWTAEQAGMKLDITNDDAYAKFITAAMVTYNQLDTVPIDLICKQTSGFPIGCYISSAAPRCQLIARSITYWMQRPV
jgi:hypothetical protein